MLALQVTDIKPFMNKLFLGDLFDPFLLTEAFFITFSTFHIDGTFKKEYYSREELEESGMAEQSNALWRQVRPFCLDLIKGKHTPLEFKIVFRLSDSNTQRLLEQSSTGLSQNDINGLFLNLYYKENKLVCTTGTSLVLFTLDKTLNHLWDDMVKRFFDKNDLSYDIL